ncbi:MAG: glycosyltransferase, partial [Pseudomonadota bacterium]
SDHHRRAIGAGRQHQQMSLGEHMAEALAHGTPVLASDVGGIKEMVRGGAGRVLPLTAPATDWTETLLEMGHEQAAYAMMADAARDRAETRLNWDHWARGIADLAAENLGSGIRNAA